MSPIILGRFCATSYQECRIEARFFPHPAAPFAELLSVGYATWCVWHGVTSASAVLILILAEVYVRYGIVLPRDRDLIIRHISELATVT
jgi:hypothetical protein